MVYEISKVHHGGEEVDLQVPGTNLERFRVRADTLRLFGSERLRPDYFLFADHTSRDANPHVRSRTTEDANSLSLCDERACV